MGVLHKTIGIVGAGTMGAGIALVALQSNHSVILCDVSAEVLVKAEAYIHARLQRGVEKGHLTSEQAADMTKKLQVFTDLVHLAAVDLVIEAVPERLELKRHIMLELEQVCGADVLFATNTSSLSVTVVGAVLADPGRLVGMHFFNPAPVMELVEIIVGDDTRAEVVEAVKQFTVRFGKQAIVCKDTPGFVVNRVARNFYGESLRLVAENSVSTEALDGLFVGGGGFKMGPFTLMDLIGIDVNYDVTRSVYQAYHQEPRYRPSPIQERMVASGRLGIKTGRGFYRYDAGGGKEPAPGGTTQGDNAEAVVTWREVIVVGDTPLATILQERVAAMANQSTEESGLVYSSALPLWDEVAMSWRSAEVEAYVRSQHSSIIIVSIAGDTHYHRSLLQAVERGSKENALILCSLAGPAAAEQASWLSVPQRVRGFHVLLQPGRLLREGQHAEWSRPIQGRAAHDYDRQTQGLLRMLGFIPIEIRDGAGGVLMRVLSMIVNEAVETVREQTALAQDIDVGMELGTHYPQGPIRWLSELGVSSVWQTLSALLSELGDTRYRPSALLRHLVLAEYSDTAMDVVERLGGER
jgi:3-hydroxybutyryl-CoA dehydrogenase